MDTNGICIPSQRISSVFDHSIYDLVAVFPVDGVIMSTDPGVPDFVLELAFDLAKDALKCDEVPVACVIFRDTRVFAMGRNQANETMNASRHAEMVAIDNFMKVASKEGTSLKDLSNACVVYVTVEPCIMCSIALREVGLTEIRFGCRNHRFGGCGSIIDAHCSHLTAGCTPVDVNTRRSDHLDILKSSEGIKASKAVKLLRTFYEGENPKLA